MALRTSLLQIRRNFQRVKRLIFRKFHLEKMIKAKLTNNIKLDLKKHQSTKVILKMLPVLKAWQSQNKFLLLNKIILKEGLEQVAG